MDFSPENLSELLGNLRPDDLQSLKDAAQSMFGSGTPPTGEQDKPGDDGIDPALLQKIARAMHAMQSGQDERAALIRALKPYLSAPRQKRADEAMQMLRLLDILPMLQG